MMIVPDAVRRWMNGRVPGGRLREADTPGTDQKASRANGLVALHSLGDPVWSPRDVSAFAREGFMQNAVAYRCVRMIAEAAGAIPLLLYRGTQEIESHPILDLMRKPSYDHTQQDFLESWYGFLLVAGNAYVEAVAVGGQVRELHILRPDRMKVIPAPTAGRRFRVQCQRAHGALQRGCRARCPAHSAHAAVSPGERSLRHEPVRSGGNRD